MSLVSRTAFSSKLQQPTSTQTVSVKSFETQLHPIPSQSHDVSHTKPISPPTRNLEKSFKRFGETITSNPRQKESKEFQDFAAEIQDNINDALMTYKTFLEANSVICQIKAFVQGDSNNTGKRKNRLKKKPSPSRSQSSGVTPTTTISSTTQKPAVSLKGSDVIIMIIKRDYNSSLGDREGVKFQDFAREVQEKVNNALKSLKGFHSLLVKKISQANSVIYQVKIFVQRESNIKGKMVTMFSKNLIGVLTETFGTTQTSSHATALTTLSPPSITKVDSVNSLTISTQTNPTKSQSVGVSLPSISEVGSQTSGTLATSQSSPISAFLSFVASHTTQTLSQASTFTSVSLSSYIDVDSVSPLTFLTQTTATQSQSIGVSLSSILELRSPTSGALTTSQSSPVSPSLSSAASYTVQTSSQANTFTSISLSSFIDADSVSLLSFLTGPTATQSQSIGVSLSPISAVGLPTSSTLTTSQSSPISPFLSFVASHTTQTLSQASTFTSVYLSSYIDADSVSPLAFLTQTTATQSQSTGVSLSSILELRSPTTGTLTTSQSSPVSPLLSPAASHTTQTILQASTFTSVPPSYVTDVDPVSSFAFSTPTSATQSQSYAVSLSSILELRSPTSGALTTSQLSPVSPSLRSAAANTMQTSWQATTTGPYETSTTKSTEKGAVFRVTVTIANDVYTEELADNTSVQFKKLSKELTAILTDIFKTKVPGFRRVEIISFRKGSVICVFQVIAEKSKASVYKIEEVLTEATKNGKAGRYTFKDVNVEQETAEATKPLSTGIASIRSETSSKAKTSQILISSKKASRSFRMDMYVKSSSLFSTTVPVSKSLQPKTASTTSATSFKTQAEPSPSQSSGVTPTTTISPTTPKPEVSLKRFNVTMTITNRDYNSSLGDKESQEFQNLAAEVRDNVKNALNDSKGFISSEVEKFLEANSVNCKLKILVREDWDITKGMIKVSVENSSKSLKLTDVTVVDTEMPTTMAVTDKKLLPNPLRKR